MKVHSASVIKSLYGEKAHHWILRTAFYVARVQLNCGVIIYWDNKDTVTMYLLVK